MANRTAKQDFIIKYIGKIAGSSNAEIYKQLFTKMSDEEFNDWMEKLKTEEVFLTIIMPNFNSNKLSVENNLEVAKELGHDFFQHIWIGSTDGSPTYLTPIKHMVIDLPAKRASQRLIKKISVPSDNETVDRLTGQPTGNSKGASITYPELQVCAAMGLEAPMVELLKYRGGDTKGNISYNNMLFKYGTANQKTLSEYTSGVESTKSLKVFLTAMHLKNTL